LPSWLLFERVSSFLVMACMYMITLIEMSSRDSFTMHRTMAISSWQNNTNLLIIFIVGYTYTARFSFVKPFFSIFLQWVYRYIAFEKEEYQLLILLCLRHFLGSLCTEKNASTCLSLFVNLTMKIMQWETSATEKLKTLFLMLLNSSSLFQLKCILMCNIRKEHSPMLRKSSDQQ